MQNAVKRGRQQILFVKQGQTIPALLFASFVFAGICDFPASAQATADQIARLNEQQTPEKAAKFVWDTVLTACKRPEESAPSLFYFEKLGTTLVLHEYAGPFVFGDLKITRATEAERRNNGLVWRAEATLTAAAGREIQKDGRPNFPGDDVWSPWRDNYELKLILNKDQSGLWADDLRRHLPVSCSIATSSDPVRIAPPADMPQTIPKVGQYVCPGSVLGNHANRAADERVITVPMRVAYVEIRKEFPTPQYLMTLDGLKTPDGSTPMVFIKSGPAAQDSCSSTKPRQ